MSKPRIANSKIIVAIGTRPEAIKLAPVVLALRAAACAEVRVVATAQHRELLDQVLEFFGIAVDRDLDLMRPDQTLAELTARMAGALDTTFAEERPDVVVAQGDTTTVLVAALTAFHRGIPFAHVEAGLRTGDLRQPFPEEGYRRVVSQLAAVHFAPTVRARDNLLREGIAPAAVHVVGNTAVDAVRLVAPKVEPRAFAPRDGRRLVFVTAHRRESFGAPLAGICEAVRRLAARPDVEVLWPVHPNPAVRDVVHRTLAATPGVRLVDPIRHADAIGAMMASALVLTDSGGVQEEAPALGKPVLVLRDTTERPEGVDAGAAVVVGTDPARIVAVAARLLDDPVAYAAMAKVRTPYGAGDSAPAIVRVLEREFPRR